MSHHLDTPLAAQSGQLFIDDLYVFPGAASTVFVLDVNSDITGHRAEPGFHPEARYEFNVHRGGAAREDLTYRVAFGEADSGGGQAVQVRVLTGDAAGDDSSPGEILLEGRTGETATGGGARLWAGRIHDSFYVDLSLLAIVNGAVGKGEAVDLSPWDPAGASNSFAGTTVESIVLEIPHASPLLPPGTRAGVWAATKLATVGGGWRQVNRGGYPMMWPIFWPDDTKFDNPANTRHPSADLAADGDHLAGQIAAVVSATGTSADPDGYGRAVAGRLLPDLLPYVVGTPASFGFAGINGRTLADNAPEVMMSLVTGQAVPSGLTPAVAAPQRRDRFPYIVPA
jgi:hypothetical protein